MTLDVQQLMHADLVRAGQAVVAAACLLGPVALLRVVKGNGKRPRRPWVSFHLKRTHALPALIQTVLFAYWALYWRALVDHFPGIGMQLLLAFTVDALLSLARWGHWRATLAPVPMTFSLNLFAIFLHGEIEMSLLALGLAVASKHVLRRREGSEDRGHIFNPSGFGIACVAVLNILWPALGDGDVAHEFNLPPNMAELIVLLALIVQTRVPVVLVTVGAAVAMIGIQLTTGWAGLVPQWAPVTLVIVLLMTDPATASRTPAGKVVFGLLAGALMQGIGFLLPDHPDFFYAKVLPIPLCNLAAPACDRIANQAIDRFHGLERALSPSRNLAHIAVWLLLFGVMVSVEKRPQMAPGHPDPHLHAFNQTPLVRFGPDGDVHCRDNPMFCAPFSFAAELRLWRESGWKRAVRSRVVENR